MKNIQVIVFDAYGTLLNIASIDQKLVAHFGDKAPIIASKWRQKQLEYTWLRSLMDRYVNFYEITKDALVYACDFAGITLTQTNHMDLMKAYDELLVYPDVKTALPKLKQHYRLAILSNATPEMLENAATYNGIKTHFEHILSVDQIKKYKPMPEVYEMAEKAFGVDRANILFISSNTWDVAGAKSFGLQVAWGNRFKGRIEVLGLEPDKIITSLEDLVNS